MSLDRLIKLAQKTGGTLIIQGTGGERDLVVLDVNEYEYLVDRDSGVFDFKHHDVRELSETELLDRINRDIGIWRANRDMEDAYTHHELLEDELEEDPFDPFAEDMMHREEWHRAGEVLENKYRDFGADEIKVTDIPDFDFLEDGEEEHDEMGGVDDDEEAEDEPWYYEAPPIDDLYRPLSESRVPFVDHSDEPKFDEEKLGEDDENIFFEEPV